MTYFCFRISFAIFFMAQLDRHFYLYDAHFSLQRLLGLLTHQFIQRAARQGAADSLGRCEWAMWYLRWL
jgi:hypothetical protein